MKKYVVIALKVGLSVAIIAWLVWRACKDNTFDDLRSQFYDHGFCWPALLGAVAAVFGSVLLTLVRWYYLVRALGMKISFREAIRIGFLGYLFNLAPMGIVGGDLLKAVMLARHQPLRRAQSVATVAVDRIIGLYVLFLVASAAVLLTGFWRHPDSNIRMISYATLGVAAVSTLGLSTLFIPRLTGGWLSGRLRQTSTAGRQLASLIEAVRLYRDNVPALALSCGLTVGVHCLFAIGFYLLTVGIYGENVAKLTLPGMFVVSLLGAATAVIPINMGPMEGAMIYLYKTVFALVRTQGLVVALAYRLITLLIATVGMGYYLSARGEVRAFMHEAEETPLGEPDAAPAANVPAVNVPAVNAAAANAVAANAVAADAAARCHKVPS